MVLWCICIVSATAALVVRRWLKRKGKSVWLTRIRGLCLCVVIEVAAVFCLGFDLLPVVYQLTYTHIWQLVVSLLVLGAVAYMFWQRSRCNPVFLKGWVIPVCIELVLSFGALGFTAFASLIGLENFI